MFEFLQYLQKIPYMQNFFWKLAAEAWIGWAIAGIGLLILVGGLAALAKLKLVKGAIGAAIGTAILAGGALAGVYLMWMNAAPYLNQLDIDAQRLEKRIGGVTVRVTMPMTKGVNDAGQTYCCRANPDSATLEITIEEATLDSFETIYEIFGIDTLWVVGGNRGLNGIAFGLKRQGNRDWNHPVEYPEYQDQLQGACDELTPEVEQALAEAQAAGKDQWVAYYQNWLNILKERNISFTTAYSLQYAAYGKRLWDRAYLLYGRGEFKEYEQEVAYLRGNGDGFWDCDAYAPGLSFGHGHLRRQGTFFTETQGLVKGLRAAIFREYADYRREAPPRQTLDTLLN